MRTFGKQAQEFMEFKINGSKKTYKMPLASSMPAPLMRDWARAASEGDEAKREYLAEDFQMRLLSKYMGEDAQELPAFVVREIFSAWLEESAAQGASAGE